MRVLEPGEPKSEGVSAKRLGRICDCLEDAYAVGCQEHLE